MALAGAAKSGVSPSPAPSAPPPDTVASYLDPNYWDCRFGAEEHYEWLKDYSHFRHLLRPFLSSAVAVLEIGCGNSRLAEDLVTEGGVAAECVTCIDLSPVAVARMRRRLAEQVLHGVNVLVADMLALPFESESFELVIEKGTTDVLFVDSGDPWNPNPAVVDKVSKMLEGIHRVLKPDGIFISISFGQPHFRRRFYEDSNFTWSFEYKTFGEGFHYFFYILRKGKRSPNSSVKLETESRALAPAIDMFHEELESEDYIFRTNLDDED